MKKITRREFIKMGGIGTMGVITLVACSKFDPVKFISETENVGELGEKYVPSVCHQCPAGCGIIVRVIDGKAVKIEGNPLHPINTGTLCPKGQIGLDLLYDPDRITEPMKRTNPRKGVDEDPQFISVSWEEALDDIAQKLQDLRNGGLSHTVAILGGRYRGQSHDVAGNFLKVYGSPNDIQHSSICADASKRAHSALDGNYSYSAYDWDNCNYLLSFGCGFIEAWRPTTTLLRAFGNMRRGRPTRAKIVQLDTRLSVTAAKADEWLSPLPGTDGAIALAMAHIILVDGLWNKDFMGDFLSPNKKFETGREIQLEEFQEKWTFGLVDWWNNVLKDFTPEKAEKISGVSAAKIARIAREFATTLGVIAAGERGAGAHTNGTYNRMAIHTLNALVGSMWARGGLMYQLKPPYGKWPVSEKEFIDEIAKSHGRALRIDKAGSPEFPLAKNLYQNVADNHLKSDPYKLNMVFLYYTNPLFSPPHPQRFWEAFKDVFVVESSSYLSETGFYADYILPDHSYLEKWLDDSIYPSLGYAVTGLRQPVVEPLYDTRNFCDVLIDIGKRLEGKPGEYFRGLGSFKNILEHVSQGLGISFEEWAQKGVWVGPAYPYSQKNGAFYKNNKIMTAEEIKKEIFKTKSGKFEFRSTLLEEKGYNPYPHWQEPKFATGPRFDLYLNSPKLMNHAEGRGANTPDLQEMFDVTTQTKWETVLWVNPQTAQERGIHDNDEVWLESPVAKIKVRAKYFIGCHPKVVVLPFEGGHFAYGRFAKGRGANPNLVIANLTDPISGQAAYNDTMVKVYRT